MAVIGDFKCEISECEIVQRHRRMCFREGEILRGWGPADNAPADPSVRRRGWGGSASLLAKNCRARRDALPGSGLVFAPTGPTSGLCSPSARGHLCNGARAV